MTSFDVIVIGGGHNGLVCATMLAKAGRKVLVLEAASELGGAARTEEFAPGFRVSSIAHRPEPPPPGGRRRRSNWKNTG